MSKLTIICQVKKGKLELDQEMFKRQLKAVPDGMYNLAIEPFINNITHNQRKYFYGVVVKTLQMGFAEDKGIVLKQQEIVDYLKDQFMFREVPNPIYGEMIKVPISLSNSEKGLTKEEFQVYKERIQEHAATVWNINIPDPNEIDYSTK